MNYIDMNMVGMMDVDCSAAEYNFSGYMVFQDKGTDAQTQEQFTAGRN
jgi:hypothetical protein